MPAPSQSSGAGPPRVASSRSGTAVLEANFVARHYIGALVAGAVVLAVGLWLGTTILDAPGQPGASPLVWLSILVVMIGGAMMAVALRRLLAPRPYLRISPEGLLDHTISIETVPWDAVETVYVTDRLGAHLMVRLDPDHPATHRTRRVEQAMAGLNRTVGAPGFAVSWKGLDQPMTAIAAAIDDHVPVDLPGGPTDAP
ncbi:MAG: STM3941 family protein [Pseudomonadota bacterium]